MIYKTLHISLTGTELAQKYTQWLARSRHLYLWILSFYITLTIGSDNFDTVLQFENILPFSRNKLRLGCYGFTQSIGVVKYNEILLRRHLYTHININVMIYITTIHTGVANTDLSNLIYSMHVKFNSSFNKRNCILFTCIVLIC